MSNPKLEPKIKEILEPEHMKEVPQNLLLMQLVINGAISILERETQPNEIIQTALYWLKFEVEDTFIPAAIK